MADFHFSPRPNRAGEIGWMTWGDDALASAASQDKPILLGISAVWCHWCHVMDETTYSDPGVIDAINRHFVAVRVDNDERPDINARYNMGGWPTTAFLTPDGSTITGFTYLPPSQMRRALDEIARFYTEGRSEIAARTHDIRVNDVAAPASGPIALQPEIVTNVAQSIAAGYDPEFGGFGNAPKFPQPEVLEFLLARSRAGGDVVYYDMVARTMREMSSGGMYDRIEGGFFRYSTTRDWSVPHFEKMAEDHAGLIRVLAQLQLCSPRAEWCSTLQSTLAYLRNVFIDETTSFFAGSQDADEAYFALDLETRRRRPVPYVDHRSYSNWTAGLAGAFAWASSALDDDSLAVQACATLDSMHERLRDENGLIYHVFEPGAQPRVRGLLVDQAAYLRALIDTYEHTGEKRFIDRAIAHAATATTHFASAGGGFVDHAGLETAIGRLGIADRPIVDNGIMAETLLRLSAITADERYRAQAVETLQLYGNTYASAGQFAATYARALDRYFAPATSVALDGTAGKTRALRAAAFSLPVAFVSVAMRDCDGPPAAYVCRGTVCAAPVSEAHRMIEALESIAGIPGDDARA
ncbi:MAG: DUF255 domain-containing protein [Candidatus Eremiobacteraeota bacterium]|nr:DUF255 domain-containing protein [Candidatus Eremiobacteraeota bacterium]